METATCVISLFHDRILVYARSPRRTGTLAHGEYTCVPPISINDTWIVGTTGPRPSPQTRTSGSTLVRQPRPPRGAATSTRRRSGRSSRRPGATIRPLGVSCSGMRPRPMVRPPPENEDGRALTRVIANGRYDQAVKAALTGSSVPAPSSSSSSATTSSTKAVSTAAVKKTTMATSSVAPTTTAGAGCTGISPWASNLIVRFVSSPSPPPPADAAFYSTSAGTKSRTRACRPRFF